MSTTDHQTEINTQNKDNQLLILAHPDIKNHTFLDQELPQEDKESYIKLLALGLTDSSVMNKNALSFIAKLADKIDMPDILPTFMHCADNINKLNECKDELKALLDSADKVYTWLLDVFHLLTISQIDIQNQHIDNLLNILKPRNFIDNYPHLCTLLTEQEPNKAFVAIQALVSITHCWKNAIAYCNIDFSACFLDLKSQLIQIEYQTTRLSSDFPNPFYVAHSCLYNSPIISDGWRALVAKGWGNIGRKYNFSYLKKSYQKISAFLFSHQRVLNRANDLFFL